MTMELKTTESKMVVAAVQMVSTPMPQENFAVMQRLVKQAAEQGAQIVLLPEYWPIMGMHENDKVAHAESTESATGGPIQDWMAQQAKENGIWLIGGTLPLKADDVGKVLNT